MRRFLLALPLLFGLGLWLLPSLVPHPPLRFDIGAEAGLNEYGEGRNLYNFFGWSEPQPVDDGQIRRSVDDGSMVVPWAFRMGQPLEVRVRWCECEPITAPLTLTINGTEYPLADSLGFRTDTYRIAYTPTIYERDLFLRWSAPNGFGPAVDSVEVIPLASAGRVDGTLWALGGLLLLLGLGWRRLSTVDLGVWLSSVGLSLWIGRVAYRLQVLPWTALVVLGVLYALALTWWVPQRWARLGLWMAGLWFLFATQTLGSWVLDDAFISFRYARNLIQGHGLTFNPGGEIVEGYTNFLWTMQMALMLALGYEPLVAAHFWTLAFALATLVVLYRCAWSWISATSAETGWRALAWSLLPILLLTANAHFVLYTARGSGMETAQVALLTTLGLWLLWRSNDWRTGLLAGVVCALATMARPDAALIPLAGGLWLLGLSLLQRKRALWLALAGLCGGFALLYAPYFIWRLSYYGYLLPNTFYAKTGFTAAQVQRGWRYTYDFALLLGLRTLLGLLGFSVLGWLVPALRRRVALGPIGLLWIFTLLTLAYVAAVGGDHFPNGRFFISLLPALMLLLTHGLRIIIALAEHVRTPLRWAGYAVGAALLALALQRNLQQYPATSSRIPARPIWGENSVALKNREVGYWLEQNTPPDTVIATGIAGTLPYYSQRTVIDALGLNDLHIAHLEVEDMGQGDAGSEKTDPHYVLSLKPQVIPFSTSGDFQPLPEFQANYELITVGGPEGRGIKLYVRKDWQR